MDFLSNFKKFLAQSLFLGAFCSCFILASSYYSIAQSPDSVKQTKDLDTLALKKKKHSPALATVLSSVCPGAGQIYNRKYWKLPIVWGGMGAFGYLFFSQNTKYQDYKKSLIARLDDDPLTVDTKYTQYTDAQIKQLKENTGYNRDLMAVLAGLFYVLNIVDANVDGHLYDFDVSDNLSLKIQPATLPLSNSYGYAPAVSVSLNFKK